ncbi:DnaJ domain [Macleaya cordata]|uniref:DnaJ domain n=1 Tax=Macleaya cordata TaxID=56857 RepID=A0A200Q8I3_MACCD|nr:DnaJ domain [Macleaya cordata]
MEISTVLSPKIGREILIFLPKTRVSSSSSSENLCKKNIFSSRANNNLNIQRDECKTNTNFYEVLCLDSKNVGYEEIKKAYRRMALQYHPDICPPSRKEESTKRFVELQRAYETLSDPISRNNYDYELALLGNDDYSRIRRSSFPKEVWENQLSGLKRRSHDRMQRNRKG